jgi:hypothetical protein
VRGASQATEVIFAVQANFRKVVKIVIGQSRPLAGAFSHEKPAALDNN